MKRYVAYLRVSTAQQGQSGLGIEAQRASVLRFINGDAEVISWFAEVESGKNASRPELKQALLQCEMTGATLIVSTLDGLMRDERFLWTIRDAGVAFQCADMPFADELVIDLMARLARYEREKISERTKAALAAAKARGVKLGCPNGAKPLIPYRQAGAIKAGEGHRARADAWAEKRRGLFEELAGLGLREAARELNARHIQTPRGSQWNPMAVKRVRDRLGLAPPQ